MIRYLEELDAAARPCVIFDFDGTVADTMPYIIKTARTVLSEYGMSEEEMGDLSRLVGPSFPEAFTLVYGVSESDADAITEAYRKIYFTYGGEAWPPFPGVPELLSRLRAEGKKLAIASSKNLPMLERSLADDGLEDAFDLVLGRSLAGVGEKAEFIVRAYTELGFSAEDAVMVGDRHFDVKAATEAGVPCVGVTYGGAGGADELEHAGAAIIVDTVEELGEILL